MANDYTFLERVRDSDLSHRDFQNDRLDDIRRILSDFDAPEKQQNALKQMKTRFREKLVTLFAGTPSKEVMKKVVDQFDQWLAPEFEKCQAALRDPARQKEAQSIAGQLMQIDSSNPYAFALGALACQHNDPKRAAGYAKAASLS